MAWILLNASYAAAASEALSIIPHILCTLTLRRGGLNNPKGLQENTTLHKSAEVLILQNLFPGNKRDLGHVPAVLKRWNLLRVEYIEYGE